MGIYLKPPKLETNGDLTEMGWKSLIEIERNLGDWINTVKKLEDWIELWPYLKDVFCNLAKKIYLTLFWFGLEFLFPVVHLYAS